MKVLQSLRSNLSEVLPDFNQKVAMGYTGFFGIENKTNALFAPLICATQDKNVDLATSVAIAFAKTPMVMAAEAYSLNQYCKGRFALGLGSQVKAHITRRFSMPWTDKPARQMREYINALHAIWDCYEQGGPLNFLGETYKHTLMAQEFVPYLEGFGRPRILLGAVGPRMTELAVDLASGLITHSFMTEKSFREVNLKTIEARLQKNNKPRSEFEIHLPLLIATGSDEDEYKKNIELRRQRIGFYSSTPAYRSVLDAHGWGEVQAETQKLAKAGRWNEMGLPITDAMLDTFAVVGEPKEIAPKIKQRFGDFIDTIQSSLELKNEETQYEIIKAIEEI